MSGMARTLIGALIATRHRSPFAETRKARKMERDGPNATARKLVDAHVAGHGQVPNSEELKGEIAFAIAIAELRAVEKTIDATRLAPQSA